MVKLRLHLYWKTLVIFILILFIPIFAACRADTNSSQVDQKQLEEQKDEQKITSPEPQQNETGTTKPQEEPEQKTEKDEITQEQTQGNREGKPPNPYLY